MTDRVLAELADHVSTAQATAALAERVRQAGSLLCETFARGGIVYTLGNGGSAADAQHLTGELIGRFKRDRGPLPSVTLSTDPTVLTCIGNDYSFDDIFSRQIEALVRPADLVIAFTTSGRSSNVVTALKTAQAKGAKTLLFGGGDGGLALPHADHALLVPSSVTARIQEMHTLLLHAISEMVDAWAAGEESAG